MRVKFGSGATTLSVNLLLLQGLAPEGWEQAAGVQVLGGAVGQRQPGQAEELLSQAESTKDTANFLFPFSEHQFSMFCFIFPPAVVHMGT